MNVSAWVFLHYVLHCWKNLSITHSLISATSGQIKYLMVHSYYVPTTIWLNWALELDLAFSVSKKIQVCNSCIYFFENINVLKMYLSVAHISISKLDKCVSFSNSPNAWFEHSLNSQIGPTCPIQQTISQKKTDSALTQRRTNPQIVHPLACVASAIERLPYIIGIYNGIPGYGNLARR